MTKNSEKLFCVLTFLASFPAFAANLTLAKGLIFLPGDNVTHKLTVTKAGGAFQLASDPFASKVQFQIKEQ